MKIYFTLLIIICLLVIATTIKIKKVGEHENKLDEKIKSLFNVDEKEEGECKKLENKMIEKTKSAFSLTADGETQIPKKKTNPWQEYSKGDSAFLFDHLDDVLQSIIANKYKKIYDAALEAQTKLFSSSSPPEDPYSYKYLLNIFLPNKYDASFPENKNRLAEVWPHFIRENWDNYITFPTFSEVCRDWSWVINKEGIKDFNKFDFNGDGRLDRKEFILYSIIMNKSLFGTKTAKQDYFYDDIFAELIDPMFMFIDCDKNGSVTSEEIWNGLRNLKRKNKDKYSLFSCKLKMDMEKEYRTISINDFILTNGKKKKAEVNLEEFRTGILLGYWKRQTRADKIVTDDTFAYKNERWIDDGKDDKMCLNIKFFLKENAKMRKATKAEINEKQ